MSQILDYSCPGARPLIQSTALVRLQVRHKAFQAGVALRLAIGGAVCLLGPAILARIMYAILPHNASLTWGMLFGIGCFTLIPLLFWIEWRSRGSFFADEMLSQDHRDITTDSGFLRTGSYGEWELRTTAATWAACLEILLTGPRLVMGALLDLKVDARLRRVSLERAAEVLAVLYHAGGGIAPNQLLKETETPQDLAPVAEYLQFHHWIDLSKAGDRVWLLSEARKQLN